MKISQPLVLHIENLVGSSPFQDMDFLVQPPAQTNGNDLSLTAGKPLGFTEQPQRGLFNLPLPVLHKKPNIGIFDL
jgi:hypothetical protein